MIYNNNVIFIAECLGEKAMKVQPNKKLTRVEHYRDLIITLTQKEVKVRYKSTILGYVWPVAHLLAFAFIFFVALKLVMRIQTEGYAVFLVAGFFPWQWLSNSVNASPSIFLHNTSLIQRTEAFF